MDRVPSDRLAIKTVLFVCTGNICRSPMAEAFFNLLSAQAGLLVRARSAGLDVVLDHASPDAISAAREYGVDLSSHHSQQMSDALADQADLILTMTKRQKRAIGRFYPLAHGKTFRLLEFAGHAGDIADPYGLPLSVYRRSAGQIWLAVKTTGERLNRTDGFPTR